MPGDAGHASHTLSRPKKLVRTGFYKPFIKLDKSKSSSSTAALGETAGGEMDIRCSAGMNGCRRLGAGAENDDTFVLRR